MDTDLIYLVPAADDDCEFAFRVKKAAEGDYIREFWPWDEVFQREFHRKEWERKRPEIIRYAGRPIGTLAVSENDGELEIGRFFILPEYQNRGIGSHLLGRILEMADRRGMKTKLAFLRNNPVESLYLRHGFHLVKEEGNLRFMQREPRDRSGDRD